MALRPVLPMTPFQELQALHSALAGRLETHREIIQAGPGDYAQGYRHGLLEAIALTHRAVVRADVLRRRTESKGED